MKIPSVSLPVKMIFLIFTALVAIRFISLTSLPVFGDEALYLYLADKFQHNPAAAFDSITFGVMPTVIWMQVFLQKITFGLINPLVLGRGFSVVIDLCAAWLIFKTGKILFGHRAGVLAAFIYLLLPLNFLQSRMFLLDSFTNFFTMLALYLFAKGTAKGKFAGRIIPDQALLLSVVLAVSFFTKPLAAVTFPAIFTLPIIYSFKITRKKWKQIFLNISAVSVLFVVILFLIYLPISREFSDRFVSSSNSSAAAAIAHLKINLWRVNWWTNVYLTLPVLITTLAAALYAVLIKNIRAVWLVFWMISVILLDCIFSANFFPRHLYPLVPPVTLISAFLFSRLFSINRLLAGLLLVLVLIPSGNFAFQLLVNPYQAPLALEDRQQYFEDWTSGAGNQQITDKLAEISKAAPITVFAEDSVQGAWAFSHIYNTGHSTIIPLQGLAKGQMVSTNSLAGGENYYIIIEDSAPKDRSVKLIYSYPKGPNRTINLYQIIR